MEHGRLTAEAAAELIKTRLDQQAGQLLVELPFFQLADDLAASVPTLRAALTVTPPPSTQETRYDAAIAALVELRCTEVGIEPPEWVHDPHRVADPAWLVCGLPSLEPFVRAETPEAFLRRGVLVSADDLVSV